MTGICCLTILVFRHPSKAWQIFRDNPRVLTGIRLKRIQIHDTGLL